MDQWVGYINEKVRNIAPAQAVELEADDCIEPATADLVHEFFQDGAVTFAPLITSEYLQTSFQPKKPISTLNYAAAQSSGDSLK